MGPARTAPGQAPPDDAFQQSIRNKTEQVRKAQESCHLDPAWDPADVMAFVSQLAMSGAIHTEPAPTGPARDTFPAARRAAIVAAVERLFPAARHDPRE